MTTALCASLYVLILVVLALLVVWEYRRRQRARADSTKLDTEPTAEVESARGFVRPKARPAPVNRYH